MIKEEAEYMTLIFRRGVYETLGLLDVSLDSASLLDELLFLPGDQPSST
jgi:hypothetical protein